MTVLTSDTISSDRQRVNVMSYILGSDGLNNHYPRLSSRPVGMTVETYLASCVRDALANKLPSWSAVRRQLDSATISVYGDRGSYRYVVFAPAV